MSSNNFRFDLYFSYWILFWALLSFIFNFNFPFISIFICLISQLYYFYDNCCLILNSKENYVILGNTITIFIKFIFLIFGLIYKYNNYNFFIDLFYSIILFIIFNIYYYIHEKKIYYLFTYFFSDSNTEIPINSGPMCNLFNILLNK